MPFALFVVLGSLLIAVWLTARVGQDSRESFRTLAETNARFIARSNLPLSGQLEQSLSEVLEIDVDFIGAGELSSVWAHRFGEVVDLGDSREAVVAVLDSGAAVRFARPRPGFGYQLLRGSTLWPLAVFWMLSFVLAAVISRKLVRPMRLLAEGVDHLGGDHETPPVFAGSDRKDEIGQLSRALTETHSRLIDERRKREEGERSALLGKMATGLAHEIRNPVAAIRLHAQLLEGCESCASSSQTIVAEAGSVEGLVNQWMFLSKPQPPEKRCHDLGELLNRCKDALAPAAEHAGVRIVTQLAEPLMADVDEARLGQVLRNILLNAIHAMPDGGELELRGRCLGDGVEVSISDGGAGFSDEALRRYGELFFSTKEGGMGVGLSVSAEIMKAHGGELLVANREGGGATVTLRLPQATDH